MIDPKVHIKLMEAEIEKHQGSIFSFVFFH